MKIFLEGRDNFGWHIDVERQNILESMQRLGLSEAGHFWSADVVHVLWWNLLLEKNFLFRMKKNIVATTSNFVDLDDPEYFLKDGFEKVRRIAKAFIAPSTKQKRILEAHGVRSYYQPFYLDLSLFRPADERATKEECLRLFNIPPEAVEGRIIIGSFQRDSLGVDLSKPKWQKGPELLIDLLQPLPKDKFVLLLAGPRRHYVLKQCRELNIPYYYIGTETEGEDLDINIIEVTEMPYLYYLTDIYLVTSKSEGGPKAVMEAAATKTFILSTDVGLAGDFLEKENVLVTGDEYHSRLREIINTFEDTLSARKSAVEEQFETALTILNEKAMDQRLYDIYRSVIEQ